MALSGYKVFKVITPKTQILLSFLIYIGSVFVIARILGTVIWIQQGMPPTQIVDLTHMKLAHLKLVLKNRGVSYDGFIEKNEFAMAAAETGAIVKGEIEEYVHQDGAETQEPTYTMLSAKHLREEVHEQPWLVFVIGNNEVKTPLDYETWRKLRKYADSFEIPVGILDCEFNEKVCNGMNLKPPKLILLQRVNLQLKFETCKNTRFQAITKWIEEEFSRYVAHINNFEDLKLELLGQQRVGKYTVIETKTKVIFFTNLQTPPLFLSALSIKLKEKVTFKMFSVDLNDPVIWRKLKLLDMKVPSYVVITSHSTTVYGGGASDYINYQSMDRFLSAIQPDEGETIDFFWMLANVMWFIQILQVIVCARQGKIPWATFIVWTICSWIRSTFTFIVIFYVMKLLDIIPILNIINDIFWIAVHFFILSNVGEMLRNDWQFLQSHPTIFIITLIVYGNLSSRFFTWPELMEPSNTIKIGRKNRKRRAQKSLRSRRPNYNKLNSSNDEQNSLNDEQDSLNDEQDSLNDEQDSLNDEQDSSNGQQTSNETGHRDVMERLTHLVMTPFIDTAYITNLPVWTLRKSMDESDEDSSSSEDYNIGNGEFNTNRSCPGTCSVCLETYELNSLICDLPCRHKFHEKCIKMWLSSNHSCPICRWPSYRIKFSMRLMVSRESIGPYDEYKCYKCSAQIAIGSWLYQLPCRHFFHDNCIFEWLSKHPACPECKWPAYRRQGNKCF